MDEHPGAIDAPPCLRRGPGPLAVVFCLLLLAAVGAARGVEDAEGRDLLRTRHALWLETVSPLLTESERSRFQVMDDPDDREAFIEGFWRSRDRKTGGSGAGLRERWERNARLVRDLFGGLTDDRARALLLIGARPQKIHVYPCPALGGIVGDVDGDGAPDPGDLRVWVYPPAWVVPYGWREPLGEGFSLVFLERCTDRRGSRCHEVAHRIWTPGEGSLHDGAEPPETVLARTRARGPESGCFAENAVWDELATALRTGLGFWELEERLGLADLRPESDDWIDAALRELRPTAPGLATLRLGFPARAPEGTILEGVVEVSRSGLEAATKTATERAALVLEGELVALDRQVDRFTYRFHLPLLAGAGDSIVLPFHRRLAPGSYGLVLQLHDNAGAPLWRELREVVVADLGAEAAEWTGDEEVLQASAVDVAPRRHEVRLQPPAPGLHVGPIEVEVSAFGPAVSKVELWLDGKRVGEDSQAPYRLAADLGQAPRPHVLRAVAVDEADRQLAWDEIRINAGPHRFVVRLLEPSPREAPETEALMVRAAVEHPRGTSIDRVELYLDDQLSATLFQPPFIQLLPATRDRESYFVRAVAHLEDGRTAEDTVFLHPSGEGEEIEVELVELYATVLDGHGRPVPGLAEEDFTVLDEGEEQPIHRFQTIEEVPVHVGLLIDVSASMDPHLDQVRASALRFFGEVLRPGDEAAVLAFDHRPRIVAAFTEHPKVLQASMVGLAGGGGTALHDSLIFASHYFGGLPGKRALVVLSDGEDLHSRASADDALEYARRIGIAIYPILIGSGDHRTLGTEDPGLGRRLRRKLFASDHVRALRQLARESGGRYFAVEGVDDLDTVYRILEEELRSQYLVAYHMPPNAGEDFRRVELRVENPDLVVHTMGGYFP